MFLRGKTRQLSGLCEGLNPLVTEVIVLQCERLQLAPAARVQECADLAVREDAVHAREDA